MSIETALKMTGAEVLAAHANGRRDFSHMTIQYTSLRGARLEYCDFHDCDFTGTDLSNATLRGADLRDCDLSLCNFEGAVMEHAQMQRANLHLCRFRNAILSYANLDDADVKGAEFICSYMKGTRLNGIRGAVASWYAAMRYPDDTPLPAPAAR